MTSSRYVIEEDQPQSASQGSQVSAPQSSMSPSPNGRYLIEEDQDQSSGFPSIGAVPTLRRAAGIAGSDIASIPGKIGGAVERGLNAAPSEITGALNPTHPIRNLENLGIGAGNVAQGLMNVPSSLAEYLAHLGIISPKSAGIVPRQTTNPIQQELQPSMGAPQAGDALIQGLPQVGAMLLPGDAAEIAANASKVAGTGAANLVTGIPKAAQAGRTLENANQSALSFGDASDLAKAQAKTAGLPTDPNALQAKSLQTQQAIQDVQSKLAESPPITPKNIEESATNLQDAKSTHDQALQAASDAKNNIQNYLNIGGEHDVDNAVELQKEVQSVENDASSRYKNLLEKNQDSTFSMPDMKNYEINKADVLSQLKAGIDPRSISTSAEISPQLQSLLDLAPTVKDTNIADFMAKQKDFSSARNGLLRGIRDDPSAQSRQARIKAYNDSRDLDNTIQQSLQDGLGASDSKELSDINNQYRTQVYPLRNNETVVKAQDQGRLSKDMMDEIRGRAEGQTGVGQDLVRQIFQRNPTMLRNSIGQKFSENPDQLLSPSARTQNYINKDPVLKNMIDQHESAKKALSDAKSNLDEANSKHADILKKSSEYQGNRSKVENLQDDLSKIDTHLAQLRQTAARRDLSLKDKMKAQAEYNRLSKIRTIKLTALTLGGYGIAKKARILSKISEIPQGGE